MNQKSRPLLLTLKILFSLTIALTLTACATPYYGHSTEDWAALSEQEQAAIKAEYAAILKLREDQKHSDILEQRRQQIIKRGTGNTN